MDENIKARWANFASLRTGNQGAPTPVNWVPSEANVSTSAVQAPQATIPQFFNFIGSSAGNVPAMTGAPVMPFSISQNEEKSPPRS